MTIVTGKMTRAATVLALGLVPGMLSPSHAVATNWLTYHYDNARDGANTNEVVLTPANVNTNAFFKLFTYTVDAEVYAQPLYMANVAITGQGTHNVLFVATENDSVYAFDADSNLGTNGGLLWQTNLGTAATSVLFGTRYHHNVLNPILGITGTPVIDPVSGTLYVNVLTTSVPDTTNAQHHVHALNIANGSEQPYSPVLVTASVPGTGVDSSNGVVTFNANQEDSRPALTLGGGMLYVSFGSFGDTDPFHGWVIGFNATNLQQVTNYAFASTPNAATDVFGVNAGEGALWMGGGGLCVDSNGNLFFETGNGSFSANTNGGDYGDCFVKLSTSNKFLVADYFSPSNQAAMAANDADLGSGAPTLLPDSAGSVAHPHLMIGAGKEGTLYLVDRDDMGHFSSTTNSIVQTVPSVINGGSYGTPAYFNHWIYYQGAGDVMRAFAITNGVMTTSPVSQSTVNIGNLGYSPVISANGTSNAIVWVIDASAYNNSSSDTSSGPAVLRAFNATNLSQELYNSSIKASDNAPGTVKYPVPTVADGKVFVAGDYGVAVYGLGVILPPPTISPNGGVYTNSVTVTLTDATNTTTIFYTLDGTTPTTNSLRYTGPFTLTNTVALKAIAAQPGAFNSGVATDSFINSSSIGTGTGLLGSYWSNTASAAFTNASFTNLPTLTRTDATVNFNFGGNGPSPFIGGSNYCVRWTGSVQPQFSERYTFYTTSDDGVLLYVNGQLLINDWVNQGATLRSNTIALSAQQLYNLELDYYYQNDNGGQVALAWSSPSTPQAIIPQSQLYPYTNPPPTIVLSSPSDGAIYSAIASVSIGAMVDAPYNPIRQVAFYANGSLLGTLSNSPTAPLYAMTVPGFMPNPGGATANSSQVSATPGVTLSTTNVEAQGADWTAAIWKTNGTGTAVAPTSGNPYALVFNGITVGNGTNNTRIRSPAVSGTVTFAGNSLSLNTNTELRTKGTPPTTLNFPGAGGNPGLILNGGLLNNGDNTSPTVATITGSIQVIAQSYNSAQGANGGGGGLAPNSRAVDIAGYLSGHGNLVIMNCSTNLPQVVSCPTNTFSGQWIVQCGWLQGTNANSLGSNSSIVVDPDYTGYLAAMPNASSPAGPALLEVNYDLATSGTLTLVNGGKMNLHQNCAFAAVTIEGTPLSPGTYSYAQLGASFPNNFLPGGSGSITVAVLSGPPGPTAVPLGLTAMAGNAQASLFWNASLGATNYNLMRSTTNGGPYRLVASLNGTSYTDTGLTNGTTYYYVLSAVSAPGYTLTAVATDGSGLSSTSAPIQITINAGSGLPYGMTTNGPAPAFFNLPTLMPATLPGSLPLLLSQTGVYNDTPNRIPASGLIPYVPNTPLWSDGAQKSRYLGVPSGGGPITPATQIAFLATNTWTFPAGTIFVKNFDLAVNATNTGVPMQRLETRLLVRDINGGVYGVTYKWRPDNSDADLLITSSNQTIVVTNATGVTNQTWYYPSPVDCLTCHTPVANYVLGVDTRQLNGSLTYPATGIIDNQLRTLNRLGLFNPAFDEADITNFEQLSALTNLSASLEQRARSYLDANCAQCHQPGGAGITFDARYDTPLANQNITNYPAQLSLGFDNACIVKDKDIWRSVLLYRMNSTDPAVKMPTLARNLLDTNAIQVITDWINSLPGIPALAPPVIMPNGGTIIQSVTVTLHAPDTNATIYYTLDGTLPTIDSFLYSAPFVLTNSATVTANAFETNFDNSVAASALFSVQPRIFFTSEGFATNGAFRLGFSGVPGSNYILQATTNFISWVSLSTNQAPSNQFNLFDPGATNYPYRFYRILGQ